ncbi:hypothetical protein Cassandra_0406 [Pseudomonas phage Cassandra]|nr:hypothetical protein Cassandra_0406 [Pseudomonas phage Cassandra]
MNQVNNTEEMAYIRNLLQSEDAVKYFARKVNDLIGKEAFERLLNGLSYEENVALNLMIENNLVSLHSDGFVGIKFDLKLEDVRSDVDFTNEGFELEEE